MERGFTVSKSETVSRICSSHKPRWWLVQDNMTKEILHITQKEEEKATSREKVVKAEVDIDMTPMHQKCPNKMQEEAAILLWDKESDEDSTLMAISREASSPRMICDEKNLVADLLMREKIILSMIFGTMTMKSEKKMENMDVERGDIVHKTVQSLLDCVGEKNNFPNKFSPSIYMAPSNLRDLSPSSFKPRVVSIGPLHRKDENLQRFEVQKASFVNKLLSRKQHSLTQQVQTLTECVEKVASMIEEIKGSYVDIKSYEDSELAKMMVMDACFILEFIHNIMGSNLRLQEQYIPYDLVLLENQIPFFVLQGIYDCIIHKLEESLPLTKFILPILKYINLFEGRTKVGRGSRSYANHDHILGYLHHCYRPTKQISSGFPKSTIHSVIELDRAGVNFKPNQNSKWVMAMEVKISRDCSSTFWFSSKPTLTMPKLRIDDFTELVLRNLIAYEQSYVVKPYVTSYARAMDMLIDTHEDIAKLVTSKVLVNHIGSNEEAANMINRICKEVVPEHFYYTQQWEQLDGHFKGYWPRKIVKLKRTYFNSPWSIIALFAGFILFILAMLQTIFTIKSS
ncbi:hypothetical protein L1987_32512 [Smallanthus sonchifolius]|uniref:Uncharacterized protein n=1 Tax=Smallanthus sonchifolius TaxID=185202 RepID=A0ACB9HN74_9ASTR|nr:hypothetical protein L1987_32512 [Smallanthus sonchifolius]